VNTPDGVHDQRLEAFHRAFAFVPMSQYDEVTKLAEYALRDLLTEVVRLRGERDRLARGALAALALLEGIDYEEGSRVARAESALGGALEAVWLSDREDAKQQDQGDGRSASVVKEACYCGELEWTVRKHGRITHKHSCPARTDRFCQTHPQGCQPRLPLTDSDKLSIRYPYGRSVRD
jgi:hypothetical protein